MRALGALGKPDWRGSIAQLFCEGARSTGDRSNMGAGGTTPKLQRPACNAPTSDFVDIFRVGCGFATLLARHSNSVVPAQG